MKRFNSVLYVADTGDSGNSAFDRALSLALNNQAELTVLSVIEQIPAGIGMPAGGPISQDLQVMMTSERKKQLEHLVEHSQEKMGIKTKVLTGTPFLEIIREVLRNKHDILIKSPENPGWLDSLFGSEDMHILRKCPCPVWMVKPGSKKSYRRVLAAVNVEEKDTEVESHTQSSLNRQILEFASSLSVSEFTELHIAHAWQAIGESFMRGSVSSISEDDILAYVEQVRQQRSHAVEEMLQEFSSQFGEDTMSYLSPAIHLEKGWARKVIPSIARRLGIDLVVMGTVARTGIPGLFMGNTAEMILHQLDCSVLAVKPPGFRTPVVLED